MTVRALDTGQAETIGIVAIIAVAVAGAVLSAIITAIIGRIVVVVVVVLLAAYVWTQRSEISSAAKRCDASFLGVHLTPSDPALKRHCQNLSR